MCNSYAAFTLRVCGQLNISSCGTTQEIQFTMGSNELNPARTWIEYSFVLNVTVGGIR